MSGEWPEDPTPAELWGEGAASFEERLEAALKVYMAEYGYIDIEETGYGHAQLVADLTLIDSRLQSGIPLIGSPIGSAEAT